MAGVCTTLQTTAGQAFGARNVQEVSLSLQRCMLFLGWLFTAVGDGGCLWLSPSTLAVEMGFFVCCLKNGRGSSKPELFFVFLLGGRSFFF